MILHVVNNLLSSKNFLSNSQDEEIILINSQGSLYYYGIRVIYYIMQYLVSSFTEKRFFLVVNTDYLYSAFITVKKENFSMIDGTPWAINMKNINSTKLHNIKTIIDNYYK